MPKTPDIYDEYEVSDNMAVAGLCVIDEILEETGQIIFTAETLAAVYRAMLAAEHDDRRNGMN